MKKKKTENREILAISVSIVFKQYAHVSGREFVECVLCMYVCVSVNGIKKLAAALMATELKNICLK